MLAKTATTHQKLDKFIRSNFKVLIPTGKQVALAIKAGQVFVNGVKVTKAFHRVVPGDVVSIKLNSTESGDGDPERDSALNPQMKAAESLGICWHYESGDLMVLWKPSGIPICDCLKAISSESNSGASSPGTPRKHTQKCLESLAHAMSRLQTSQNDQFTCINFIDTALSGLVVIAKNQGTVRAMQRLFDSGLISETWTTLCVGNIGLSQNLDNNGTFYIDEDIEGRAASSICTFLDVSRTRNYPSSYISRLLVSPIQDTKPVPGQVLKHLEAANIVLVPDQISLTGIEFQFDRSIVNVFLEVPQKLSNFIRREQDAWQTKRTADLAVLESMHLENVEEKLNSGVPLPYISGKKEFFGIDFLVTPGVMIPKIGTEILVKAALASAHAISVINPRHTHHILDLGTGSGCILLSILKNLENAKGLGVDISPDALEIANRNAQCLSLESNASFGVASFGAVNEYLGTCKRQMDSRGNPLPFDLILTNPPYLAEKLWDSDRIYAQQKHEPRVAIVGGEKGTESYIEIRDGLAGIAKSGWIRKGTNLFVEVNNRNLANAVIGIFTQKIEGCNSNRNWRVLRTEIDTKGLERCIIFEWYEE